MLPARPIMLPLAISEVETAQRADVAQEEDGTAVEAVTVTDEGGNRCDAEPTN